MCPSDSGSIRPSPVLHGASDHSLISRGTKTTTLLTKRILHLAIITYVVSTYDKKKKKTLQVILTKDTAILDCYNNWNTGGSPRSP